MTVEGPYLVIFGNFGVILQVGFCIIRVNNGGYQIFHKWVLLVRVLDWCQLVQNWLLLVDKINPVFWTLANGLI